jgi:hypothetical protein
MLSVIATARRAQRRNAPTPYFVGQVLRVVLPVGYHGQIFIQRNGVDISGAQSAAGASYYEYTVQAADDGATLTPRVVGLTLDTTAPRRHGVQILIAAPDEVLITYNKQLSTNALGAAQFVVAGTVATAKTVLSATAVDNTVKVKVSSNFVPGDLPTLAYTQSGTDSLRVKDYAGNLAPSFSAVTVANGFPVPATAATLVTTFTILTSGGGGFVYSGSGGTTQCHPLTQATFGSSAHQSKLETSGWVEMQVTDTNAAVRSIALKMNTSAGQTLNEMDHSIRVTNGTARPYQDSTAVGSLYTFSSPSSLCRVRIRRDMPSGEVHFDTSEDGGISWELQYTWTLVSDPEVYMHPWCNNPSTTVAAIGCALQGFVSRGF